MIGWPLRPPWLVFARTRKLTKFGRMEMNLLVVWRQLCVQARRSIEGRPSEQSSRSIIDFVVSVKSNYLLRFVCLFVFLAVFSLLDWPSRRQVQTTREGQLNKLLSINLPGLCAKLMSRAEASSQVNLAVVIAVVVVRWSLLFGYPRKRRLPSCRRPI